MTRNSMRFAFFGGLIIGALGFLELGLRLALPDLAPKESTKTVNELGIPSKTIAKFEQSLEDSRHKAIVIGDSFVEAGTRDQGWVTLLNDKVGSSVGSFGIGGAAPSHYFWIYRLIRQSKPRTPILIVLYVGNDLADESILNRLGHDGNRYFGKRSTIHRKDFFWPCFGQADTSDSDSGSIASTAEIRRFLGKHSMLYRVSSIARHRLISFLDPDGAASAIESLMLERCRRPPYFAEIGGRIFFFRHHEAILDTSDPAIREARETILRSVKHLRDDPNLVFVVVSDREESCRTFHLKPVGSARGFVAALRELGARVLDPTESFEESCARQELYLPDGHWNRDGHRLFARWLFDEWWQHYPGFSVK